MAQITRVYDTHEKAADAAASLKAAGFIAELPEGATTLRVDPPFGRAAEAEAIMESFGPEPVAAAPAVAKPVASVAVAATDATPLSNALGMSVLTPFKTSVTLSPDPTPLSTKLGWKVLSSDKPKAELKPDWTLSGVLGWKLLASATASEVPQRKVLSDDATPLSSAIGWPLLSKDPTPLSSKFGWKVLSDRQ